MYLTGVCVCVWGGGSTLIHYLYRYVPPKGVVILKLLILNGVLISELFSRMGYNISNAQKFQFCTQPFEIIQGHIAFKNMVQFTNFLEQSLKNWPISRWGISFRANSKRSINFRGANYPTYPSRKCPPSPPPPGVSDYQMTFFFCVCLGFLWVETRAELTYHTELTIVLNSSLKQ